MISGNTPTNLKLTLINMLTFSKLIKEIRKSAKLNQEEFANSLGVSKIFIAQLETNKREASKNFIKILSEKLKVSSFSLMPFLSSDEVDDINSLSKIEKYIYNYGVQLQKKLIEQNSKFLKLSNN